MNSLQPPEAPTARARVITQHKSRLSTHSVDSYLPAAHGIAISARFWQPQCLDVRQVVPRGAIDLAARGRRGRGNEGEQQDMHAAGAALLTSRRLEPGQHMFYYCDADALSNYYNSNTAAYFSGPES